ncbi:hypothetical protein Leryth_006901 [Lithospermum erythrorhizon]|nr:hypothetical protein Leryth_006901 [Lithospermum erythrorhizon]
MKPISLKSDSWKKIKTFPYRPVLSCLGSILACRGVHILIQNSEDLGYSSICAFDLATEDYKIVKKPVIR